MIVGDLPPNSKLTGVTFSAAAFITILPTLVEPVKNILSHLFDNKTFVVSTAPVTIS
jgi:hypothetical protein